jgi:hypothetical protein
MFARVATYWVARDQGALFGAGRVLDKHVDFKA